MGGATSIDGDAFNDEELLATLVPFDGGVPRCFGCVDLDACRIGIVSEQLHDDRSLTAQVRCPVEHQAGPWIAHGGWTASVLDEALGHLALHLGGEPVTATLTVDYLRPVPVDEPLRLTARVEAVEGRNWHVTGELVSADDHDDVLARASGIWVRRRPDHFQRHAARQAARLDSRARSVDEPGPD